MDECKPLPLMSEPRPVSAAERMKVADAASGRNSPGTAGVTSCGAK